MDLNLFRKNKAEDRSGDDGEGFQRDLPRARKFFEHALAVADARNYAYAIECYINGLRHDPDNLAQHEALHEVALKYKVGGGKPASLIERFKSLGKDPVSRMLDAEKSWSKDTINVSLMLAFLEKAVEADRAEGELNLGEVAFWVGQHVLQSAVANKKSNKTIFVRTSELFETIGRYDMAVESCKRALVLDSEDKVLLMRLKDLETEQTMAEGGYSDSVGEEGGFRKSVRNLAKQRALEQDDQIAKTSSAIDETIERRRAEYEEDPQDIDRLRKLVQALRQKSEDETDDEAIKLLTEAYTQTGQYRHKSDIGDTRMAQFSRQLRALRKSTQDGDEQAGRQFKQLRSEQLTFELEEYTDRVKNYPTDMKLRFELGKRLQLSKKFDDAIAMFQEAQADPRNRAACLFALGVCYLQKDWNDEAVNSLKRGIESHAIADDRLALNMRYALMDALEKQAIRSKDIDLAREAQEMASQILQTNINYRDIRERLDKIRAIVDQMAQ